MHGFSISTTLTWVPSPSAHTTVANTRLLMGARAATVPRANGPTPLGASGPVTMAVACRKALENRTVSPI